MNKSLVTLSMISLGLAGTLANAQIRERAPEVKDTEARRETEAKAHLGAEAKVFNLKEEREAIERARSERAARDAQTEEARKSGIAKAAEKSSKEETIATPLDALLVQTDVDPAFREEGLAARRAVLKLANNGIQTMGENGGDCVTKPEWQETEGGTVTAPAMVLFEGLQAAGDARTPEEARSEFTSVVEKRVAEDKDDAKERVKSLEEKECKILNFRSLRQAS